MKHQWDAKIGLLIVSDYHEMQYRLSAADLRLYMLTTIILIVLFICAWIYLTISLFRWARSQSKLIKLLKARTPNIRRSLAWFDIEWSTSDIKTGARLLNKLLTIFWKLFISFGSILHAKAFVNFFVDADAIRETEDAELKMVLEKLIRHVVVYARVLLFMTLIWLVLAITWYFK